MGETTSSATLTESTSEPDGRVGDLETFPLVGTEVTAVTFEGALAAFERAIEADARTYACFCTVNMLMRSRDEPELREAVDKAGLVVPDGMPLVRIGQRRAQAPVSRVRAADFVERFAELSADEGYRHYFYGGAEGVPDEMASILEDRYPGLEVAGAYSPPFRPLTLEEDEEVVEMINASEPDVVWVGLGCPKQERWMLDHVDRIEAPIMAGIGAAFDFISGNKPDVPAPLKSNFEWLWRFGTEPRRLWKRVLVEGPRFTGLVLREGMLGPLPTAGDGE